MVLLDLQGMKSLPPKKSQRGKLYTENRRVSLSSSIGVVAALALNHQEKEENGNAAGLEIVNHCFREAIIGTIPALYTL